jgi:hypothetical protein
MDETGSAASPLGGEIEVAELLAEAHGRTELLAQSLPTIVDPFSISISAKTPYKLIAYREALYWRMEELSRTATQHFENNDLASAIVLTRAAVECAAAVCHLKKIMDDYILRGDLTTLDKRAEKLLLGSKSNPQMPIAVHVHSMLENAEAALPGVKQSYESLSEFAHPNWSGTSRLFSKIDHENILTSFGKNARCTDGPIVFGLCSLNDALEIFVHAYNAVSDALPNLVSKCEAELQQRTTKS